MNQAIKIGDQVERIGSAKDYTTGRTGVVVELSTTQIDRVRVRWMKEKDGSDVVTANAKPGSGVRTWVNYKTLRVINGVEV